jgi:hypothetical protein
MPGYQRGCLFMVWRDEGGYRYLDDSQSGYTWWCHRCDPEPLPFDEIEWLDRHYASAYARGFDEHSAYARARGLDEHDDNPIWLVYYRERLPIPIYMSNLRGHIENGINLVIAYERKLGVDHPKARQAREKEARQLQEIGLFDEAQFIIKRKYATGARLP